MSYAYTGEVLLPVTVHPGSGPGPWVIRAHATWLVCKNICVPEEGNFRLDLPAGTPGPNAQTPLFAAHDRAVPRSSPWQAQIAPDGSLWVQGPELRCLHRARRLVHPRPPRTDPGRRRATAVGAGRRVRARPDSGEGLITPPMGSAAS